MNAYDIIIKPVITEQSMADVADKKYVFQVAINANKTEIKAAVEEIFGVKVAKVNTVRMQGKVKRTGAYPAGRRAAYKKAVITLTAQAAEGYRVAKWTVNGSQAAGVDTQSYQLVLDQNSDVRVYFQKKPVITVAEAVNGSVNLQVGSNGVDSGSSVEFGDDVQINIHIGVGIHHAVHLQKQIFMPLYQTFSPL